MELQEGELDGDLKPYREGYVHGLAMMIKCRGWDLFLHATLVQSLLG